jgi:hypothetical protein
MSHSKEKAIPVGLWLEESELVDGHKTTNMGLILLVQLNCA